MDSDSGKVRQGHAKAVGVVGAYKEQDTKGTQQVDGQGLNFAFHFKSPLLNVV